MLDNESEEMLDYESSDSQDSDPKETPIKKSMKTIWSSKSYVVNTVLDTLTHTIEINRNGQIFTCSVTPSFLVPEYTSNGSLAGTWNHNKER